MINFLICFVISILCSFGMAILIVEKGQDYPIDKFTILFRKVLKKCISEKFSEVLNCTTCISVWTTLFTDIVIFLLAFFIFNSFYFFWPLSGFATAGIMWFVMEFLNSIDKGE